jgi:hypothetical protein
VNDAHNQQHQHHDAAPAAHGELAPGDVIATRVLTRDDGQPVLVEIGRPQPFDATRPDLDWLCLYRITGIDNQPLNSYAGGIDAMQALLLALTKTGDQLASCNDLGLTFHDDCDLGFPQTDLTGQRSIDDRTARRRAIEATTGSLGGAFGPGYLNDLRQDWPQ